MPKNRREMLARFAKRKPWETLGKNPNKGQYRIPGIGEYGRDKNAAAYDKMRGRLNNERARRGIGVVPPTPGSIRGQKRKHWT